MTTLFEVIENDKKGQSGNRSNIGKALVLFPGSF